MIRNDKILKNAIKIHIANALAEHIEVTGTENVYSRLSYYDGDHKLDGKVSAKYGIKCTGFDVGDNDCYVEFTFTSQFAELNKCYGILNKFIISVSNRTGDDWITSSDCEEPIEWIERVEMNFAHPVNELNFDTDAYLADFEKIKVFCILAA
jgi:hypothetical protein